MPGPIPDPDAKHSRTKRGETPPAIPRRDLPTSGYSGVVPEPIEELTEVEQRYYLWAWRTPAAAAWHETDAEVVAEWARLKAYATSVGRGEIWKTLASGKDVRESMSSAVYAQITTREDRLMLSPVARLKARAEIGDDPEAEESSSAPVSRFEEFAEPEAEGSE